MPNWLFNILAIPVVAVIVLWPILWRVAVFTAAGNVYEAITRKPEPPVHIDTPEERAQKMAEAEARNTEMFRKMELMREWDKTHPVPKGWSARRAHNAESMAYYRSL